jgi:outer membrane murein-binding lipoprotein Lpp
LIALLSAPDATVIVGSFILAGTIYTAWKGKGTNDQVKETNGWASHLAKLSEFMIAEIHALNSKADEMKTWAEKHDEKHDA